MKKRALTAISMAAVMAFGLAGCGSSAATSTAAPASEAAAATYEAAAAAATDNSEIGEITLIMSQRDQFLSTLEEAASEAAKDMGITLSVQDANQDTNKVMQFVETAANAGQKAVIVNMVDPETAASVIEAAGDMKVVFVNRVPADTSVLTDNAVYVGSDENTSGAYQGEFLADYFEAQGKTEITYILLNGILGQTSTTLRTESVLKALEERGIKATEAQAPLACDYDRAEAMNQMSTVLSAGTEFDCIISNNDEMALGAIEAMQNAGLDPASIPIVGIDATADGCAAIVNGTLAMSVFQNPVGQGAGSLQAAVNLINGDALNANTEFEVDAETGHILWVPFEPVTADNVADYQ
ncbi:MAG: substrate-binding domain-containing protein [Lachnospiraceae bacterium]|nr:substrate-binding domain-containing protein [Lachnospiraceae bacterium]